VQVDYPEPQTKYDLTVGGTTVDPYPGLDRFGRVVDNLWKQYATPATADEIKYGYDRNSNRTYGENALSKSLSTPKYFDELYAYDGLNRLTNMQRGELAGGTPPTSVTHKNFAQSWTLDPTGNWGQFQEDATGSGTLTLDQARTADPNWTCSWPRGRISKMLSAEPGPINSMARRPRIFWPAAAETIFSTVAAATTPLSSRRRTPAR
jgi:hypothetical protein